MSETAAPALERPLSWRAKYRLRLAAGLLRADGSRFDMPRQQFYEQMTLALERMPESDRERLRALVDWVEAFDPQDELGGDQRPRPAESAAGRRR